MTDTITVREACKHGKYDKHLIPVGGSYFMDSVCPGGREITLRTISVDEAWDYVKSGYAIDGSEVAEFSTSVWVEVGNGD